jgi:hypothetical protein
MKKDQLVRHLLSTQDMGEKAITNVLLGINDAERDPISAIIVNAVEQSSDKDEIWNDLEYAISMLKRAQNALK